MSRLERRVQSVLFSSRSAALALALAVAGAAGCSDAPPAPVAEITYEGIRGDGFPAPAGPLLDAVARDDRAAIRAHAWSLFARLTAPSSEIYQGTVLPIWETWYSGAELYDDGPAACLGLHTRPFRRDFESPAQHLHAHQQSGGAAVSEELVTSFNRFDQEVVDHVCARRYNSAQHLNEINAGFSASTPVIDRSIEEFEPAGVALKPVFWVVPQKGVTIFPYWAGSGPEATTDPTNPTPDTWRQCVALVPPGTEPPAVPFTGSCNGEQVTIAQVVGLDRFYHFALTAGDIENASTFGFLDGAPPEPGDYALFVAMHVTSKEIPQWTWQTFWWTPTPDAGPDGADRPAAVENEWRNYAMCAAYQMVQPEGDPNGKPVVCFNPYLETGLTGIDGIQSNCMTCHRLAAWPNFSTSYQANGLVRPGDASIFGDELKLDFLWSITRAM